MDRDMIIEALELIDDEYIDEFIIRQNKESKCASANDEGRISNQ